MENKEFKKKVIEQMLLEESRRFSNDKEGGLYTWGEIKELLIKNNITLQDDDIIENSYNHGWQEGDSSREDTYDLIIYRYRLETDEEFEKRKNSWDNTQKLLKKNRYETYLKLEKEFGKRYE